MSESKYRKKYPKVEAASAAKVISLAEFKAMSLSERSAFTQAGGTYK